jgi:uncharacterized protein (TIGR03032 family)
LHATVLMSTYQAGKLVVVGSQAGKPTFSFHSFDQVMGVAVASDRIAIGSRRQIHFLNAAHEVAPSLPPAGTYDGCFLARSSIVTGSIHGHDLAFGNEGLWVVNTLFSCLCTLDDQFNFFPRWRPPFITQLIDQDRCHLNGMAMLNGVPKYVTVLGLSDQPAGWRANKKSGGAILDVPSGEVVTQGLCMPHSPRVYRGKLWVLNSGCGELSIVDTQSGKLETVASLPGYTRGLAFYGDYAFVGLSRIRETNIFGGLPIGEHPDGLHCGLGIVELSTGRTIANLSFRTGVEELFAVDVVPGRHHPKFVGPTTIKGEEDEVWIVPPLEKHSMTPRASSTSSQGIAGTTNPPPSPSDHDESSERRIQSLIEQSDAAQAQGDFARAIATLRMAIALNSSSADLWNRLGNLQQDAGNQTAAIECYQRSVEVNPGFGPAHQNLGVLWVVHNQALRALHHFEQAQRAQPQAMNLVLAAKTLPVVYDTNDQLNYWRSRYTACVKALVADGVAVDTTNTLVDTSFYLAYQGENDREIMADLGRVYRGVEPPDSLLRRRPKGRKIRVGFLSAYFRDHTIGRLNVGRIGGLSRTDFDVTVLALHRAADPMVDAFRSGADRFVTLPRQVREARRQIMDMELDILVFADIGMDAMTQSLCYSRMAPIQASTWGHPDTSGSPAIDYFVSSALAEISEAQAHYTERLALLPTLGVHYDRPALNGPVRTKESLGLDPKKTSYVCPQTSFKFHPVFDEALSGILEADPEGELVVMEGRVPAWTEALRRRWERVLPDGLQRVRFLRSMPQPEFLHLLASADVVLDPYPFCGGNSSYEALAVGTPVVTYPSPYLRGRLTDAMYRRMEWMDLVASSPAHYIQLAAELGRDQVRNRSARETIRSRAGILFNNNEDILAWENLFHQWLGETS